MLTSVQPLLRVQLVDGDRVALHRISKYLQAAGLEVHGAADVGRALAAMRRTRPDVLVLDPAVPSSRLLVGYCRRDARLGAVPVVLVSRQVNLSQMVQDLGARAGLAKSSDLDVLVAVVARVAGRRSRLVAPAAYGQAAPSWWAWVTSSRTAQCSATRPARMRKLSMHLTRKRRPAVVERGRT